MAPARSKKKRTSVTYAEVQAAYQKTGLTPGRGAWARYTDQENSDRVVQVWDGNPLNGEACGLGVLAIAESVTQLLHDRQWPMHRISDLVDTYLNLDVMYINGFVTGFDGEPSDSTNTMYQKGLRDGRRIAKKLGLPKQI